MGTHKISLGIKNIRVVFGYQKVIRKEKRIRKMKNDFSYLVV